MRKIILNLAVSLDSLIEGPNGEYDWCIMEPELNFDAFLNSVDAVFFGRKSYELFGSQNPETFSNDADREGFNIINAKKKYVFSDTLTALPEGGEVITSNRLQEEVNRIKALPGKDIWLFGGASLVTTFVNLGLVDEYQLGLHPTVLGAGKPLFKDIQQRVELKLTKVEPYFSSGLVMLYYQPDRK